MSRMHFGIEIGATDRTQGALRSSLAGITGFAKSAAGAMRDFNLGIRPIIADLDRIIDRGSRLDVVRNSFQKLTGATGAEVDALAKKLVGASSGILRMSEAMEIANRSIASGMSLDALGTVIEFVGKKAISTGKDAAQAMDTVITGLSRGSTLMLDDYGVLIDGIDGVRAAFDRMKGKGAFDALGPAAQKAAIVNAALADMNRQLGRIGVTGKEAAFTWGAMKTGIGDAVDKLSLAFVKSEAVNKALTTTRNLLDGLTQHFDKGGGPLEVLFGKGKSGGIAGIAGTALMDVGRNVGHGIAGSLFEALAAGTGALSELFTFAKNEGNRVIDSWEERGKVSAVRIGASIKSELKSAVEYLDSLVPAWLKDRVGGAATTQPAGPVVDPPASRVGIIGAGLKGLPGDVPGVVAGDVARAAAGKGLEKAATAAIQREAKQWAEQAAFARVSSLTGDAIGASMKAPQQAIISKLGMGGLKVFAKVAGPVLAIADFLITTQEAAVEGFGLMKDLSDLESAESIAKTAKIKLERMRRNKPQARAGGLMMNPAVAAGQMGALAAVGAVPNGAAGLQDTFARLAKEQFGKVGFAGTREQVNAFMGEFALTDRQRKMADLVAGPLASRLPLSKARVAQLERERAIARRNSGIISVGGFGIDTEARKEAIEGLRQLRAGGRDLSDPGVRRRVFNELRNRATARLIRERKEGTDEAPGPDAVIRSVNQQLRNDAAQRFKNAEADRIAKAVEQQAALTKAMHGVLQTVVAAWEKLAVALDGESMRIMRAAQ